MRYILMLLITLILSACALNADDSGIVTLSGYEVVVEVDGGRVYDCVMVGYGQGRTIVDCEERK